MFNIICASLFKLFKDWTFRITMIIGVGLAGLLIGINAGIGSLDGQTMFLSAISPSQNFGLTVPINLVVFTVSEFTFGTIRNKIIAGHSKFKVYTGLFLTGLVFTFVLMSIYFLVIVGLASAIGGFNAASIGGARFIGSFIGYFFATYIFVTSLSIFVGTLMRNIGPSISLTVVSLVIVGMLPLIIALTQSGSFTAENISIWFNPLYMLGLYGNASSIIQLLQNVGADTSSFFNQSGAMIASGIIVPLYWTVIFFFLGAYLFTHRDIK